ncbi:amino acid transporter AVT1I-like [Pecten maximus]|uniref:amino acid transporter AVT1I-like n=1 Tax=Pecten maximus TaxID=6579 RepID=UPI0014584894|nr:amino acid transporter AVT1I-like [Pecten maximus]XP_033741067.1 amino acid transporter AVT1I-like [Pecten maximus]
MSTENLIHRERGLTIPSTAVFIAGDVAGTGILALSKAVEDIGWAGLILMLVFALVSTYTGILLGEAWAMAASIYDDCKGHLQDPYQLLGAKTYGKIGRYVVSTSLHVSMFGTAIVFLLISADNIEILSLALGHDISFCFWLLIIAGCLVPLSWFGTPKDFWLIGYGATTATAVAAILIVISIGLDVPDHLSVHHLNADFKNILVAFGTLSFAFGGHSCFLTFQMDMKREKDFKTAVILGYIIVLLMYVPVTSIGYFVYGSDLQPNVLNNLPIGTLSYIVLVMITLHIILAFTIVLSPTIQDVELALNVPKEFTWKRCVVRFIIVACVLFIAETIPKFSYLLALLGGSSFTVTDFICPTLLYMKMCKIKTEYQASLINDTSLEIQAAWSKPKQLLPLWKKVLNYIIIGLGTLAGLAASVSAIINIVSPDSLSMPCYASFA